MTCDFNYMAINSNSEPIIIVELAYLCTCLDNMKCLRYAYRENDQLTRT